MQQYFTNQTIQLHEAVLMEPKQAHHIQHVLRMKENSVVRIVDSNQQVYFGHIHYDSQQVFVIVDSICTKNSESKIKITLLMGLIKQEKWDYCIQKCCECGVHEIIPFTSQRSVVKVKEEKNNHKLARWNTIALEACEQSKRSHCVPIQAPRTLKEALSIEADLKLIAYEDADVKGMNVANVLKQHPNIQSVCICVGSEGGFDAQEVQAAIQQGFICVSLGSRILRAETAAVSFINYLTYHYDMLEDTYENA